MNLKFLKANLFLEELEDMNENHMIEFNILYSDVYQLPTLYFLIYNLDENNRLVSFEEFQSKFEKSKGYTHYFVSKNYEITKTNHPLNGLVYYQLNLCKFNYLFEKIFTSFLSSDAQKKENTQSLLSFWMSIVLQIFYIDIPLECQLNIN